MYIHIHMHLDPCVYIRVHIYIYIYTAMDMHKGNVSTAGPVGLLDFSEANVRGPPKMGRPGHLGKLACIKGASKIASRISGGCL